MGALHRRFAAVAVVLSLILAGAAVAGPPTDQLRTQIDRVIKTLENPALQKPDKVVERRKAVRRIAEEIFDFGETAKRSLARHWQTRTPAEREEFVQLFSDLLERSYISKVELYGGEKIQYTGDSVEGDQAKVQTKLLTKSGS